MVVYFADIGGSVDRHCLNYYTIQWNLSNPTHKGTREMCLKT